MGLVNYFVKRTGIVFKIIETVDQVAKTMRRMFTEFNLVMDSVGDDINHLRSRLWHLERNEIPATYKRLHSLKMYRIRNRLY